MIQGSSGLGAVMAIHHVTHILLGASVDIKYSPHAIFLLIGIKIVDMKLLDDFFAKVCGNDIIFGDTILNMFFAFSYPKVIETGHDFAALSCSIKLVNAIVSAEKKETPITDVHIFFVVNII